jgi:hypothetical protein
VAAMIIEEYFTAKLTPPGFLAGRSYSRNNPKRKECRELFSKVSTYHLALPVGKFNFRVHLSYEPDMTEFLVF